MGAGHNVVLFDPAAGSAVEVSYYRATGISFDMEPIEQTEIKIDG